MTKEQFLQQMTKLVSEYEEGTQPVIGVLLTLDPSKPNRLTEWNGEKFVERYAAVMIRDLG